MVIDKDGDLRSNDPSETGAIVMGSVSDEGPLSLHAFISVPRAL